MYARKLGALFASLGALGTSSFYIADGVSSDHSAGITAGAGGGNAAAILNESGGVKTAAGTCGKERWTVKTLTDPDASNVNLTPIPATVTALGSIPAPAPAADLPRQLQERNVYTVTGTIVAFKKEADSDIHLAIADPAPGPHPTMIVEFPAPYCDTGAVDQARIDAARTDFVAAFGQPSPQFQTPTGCVTVTGVFFFDKIHGQFGVAPNGGELHPVIDFKNGCPALPTTTTTTTAPSTTSTTQTTTGSGTATNPTSTPAPTPATGTTTTSCSHARHHRRHHCPNGT